MSEPTALESELLDLAEGKRIPTQASMIETLALVLSLAVDADDGISRARAFEVMEVAVRLAELDFRLLSSGAPGCRAVPDVEDNAIDESLEACRILGIDTSGDYDYLGTLRALVAELSAAKAERDEARRDAAHLRTPYTVARRRDEVTDWAAEAIARAPLLLGLCASASADDRGAFRVRNGTKPPQTPITDTQEGAIEVFLEEGPAAMVALVAERAEIKAALDAADLSLGASEPKNQAASLAQRVRWLAEARDVCVPAVLDSDLADEALRAAKVPGQPMAPNTAERVGTVIAERDELRLEIDPSDILRHALLDEALLHHIVGNLFSNACKYSPPGSPIDITLRHQAPHMVLTIRNQGPGIPEDEQAHLFEGFFRGSNVGNLPGTGLGLAITHRCVELLGGSIGLQSSATNDTTFTVTLPLSP